MWKSVDSAKGINFVHGDSAKLSAAIDKTFAHIYFDMIYIDGGHTKDDVLYDFNNLRKYIRNTTILAFDDCDPRFPGVEEAVNMIAAEMGFSINLVTFWPAAYNVALAGKPEEISRIL